ncbi:MAG TPA: TetR family transcriptional regulator [Pilimelia sp.]|nr:TetR family transcriptional regulator [Pilimelia sp.]
MTGKARVRVDLTAAAISLFLAKGYEETTVDEIAEAAGVARRTFFRYFRTKDDAVFPDHEECLKRVEAMLAAADRQAPVLAAVRDAAHVVLAMYAEDPDTAVKRYELTRRVDPLREREITATSRYQRVFTEHLHRRFGRGGHAELREEVAAATVVAAHNHVLRQWLRDGGADDAHAHLDEALDAIEAMLGPWLSGDNPDPAAPAGDEVVVVAVRRGAPMWRVVQEIEAATGGSASLTPPR